MENTMRFKRILALSAFLALSGTACADLEVTNLNDPDRERALSTASDVEALIAGAYANIWSVMHHSYPSMAWDVGADAHSASWGNFGMQDYSQEPRMAFNNSPSYAYRTVAEVPWANLYAALAATRDGLIAIEDLNLQIGAGGQDNPRTMAFARFNQGLATALLGIIYDKAYIVDETSDLESLAFADANEVFAAGIAKLDEAQQLATSNSFTIPLAWVSNHESWSSDYMARWINSLKARLILYQARSPSDPIDWAQIQSLVESGLGPAETYTTADDGDDWSWSRLKLHGSGIAGWSRADYRQLGPADASGGYATWLQTPSALKQPFNIDTDDGRITGGAFDQNGTYTAYIGSSPFPADRGTYHFSHYIDTRWNYIWENNFVGEFEDWHPKERDFILAEALYWQGDYDQVVEILNKYRVPAGLPAITSTDPDALVPGGARCVPKPDGTTCGDLLEALKWEKRTELYHYGPYTEFVDDRRWGDLVSGTAIHLPIPGAELLLLLEEIYTFGGDAGGAAPNIVADLSPKALHQKRVAMEKYREAGMTAGRTLIAH
jgi:hypothetical protein